VQPSERPEGEGVRVVVLWQRLSGYAHASFAALRDLGVDVRVVHRANDAEAPFDPVAVTDRLTATSWRGAPDARLVESVLADADPHAVLMTSWHPRAYRKAVRRLRGRTLRVLCMDNQWWGTPKQRLGVITSPILIRPTFDAAFVAGDRGVEFARRFGFTNERILQGLYSCDQDRFAAVAHARGDAVADPAFLFVGRLAATKGIDVLAEAYRRYRDMVDDPWPLRVSGTGGGAGTLQGLAGVEMLGFVQPDDLPDVMARSGCLVLPSRFEPWGVVVHEAAAAGLPVICTSVCGAASRLVLDGYNGRVIEPGDPGALARALARISTSSAAERRDMGAASRALADQFTSDRWAKLLLARIRELRALTGLDPGGPGDASRGGRPRGRVRVLRPDRRSAMTSGHDPARAAHEPVRVCVLWTRLSGYLSASLHALVDQGAELLVVHEAAAPSAPFDDVALSTGFRSLSWTGAPDLQTVGELVGAFAPDVVLVNSWHIGAYRRVARRLRGRRCAS
jgi:glycosyltransferase involved in cell wall biosynthesis